MKHSQMHPKLRNAPKHEFRVQWEWIGCVRCEKFRCDIMAQICALMALVQPVLHQVSCSNGTLTNTPKHYETNKNMSLGSNGVDRVRSFGKLKCDFMAQTCTLIAAFQPVLHQVSSINETLPNAPKHYKTHQNMSLGSNWLDRVRSF